MDHSYILELNTPSDEKLSVSDTTSPTLDLSKKGLKKVPKPNDGQNVRILILDENDLQKIDNIDSYLRIEKLSLHKNNLLRMYGVHRLHLLQELNLSNNKILTIEGLKELTQLKHLNLQGNTIKSIEHLNTNQQLEYLNLAENAIGSISDISMLKQLKELYLHGNRLTHLRQCDRYLPTSLITLTLAHNNISDLNEICTLGGLAALNSISIQENPCVEMTGNSVFIYKNSGFDYRPFVLNWCMTVKVIDGFVVNPIESLKAEWLYSQGRGRQFRVGEQVELAKYLSSVCPMTGEALENEDDRKLRLILSKAQQHQRQLQEEISEHSTTSTNNSPSSNRRRGTSNRIQSPRFSRLGRPGSHSPDSMSSSYHGNTSSSINNDANTLIQMSSSLIENVNNDHSNGSNSIMVQSLDPTILSSPLSRSSSSDAASSTRSVIPQLNDQQARQSCPLVAASKMVPVPESLMSPDCPPLGVSSVHQRSTSNIPTNANSNASPNNKLTSLKSNRESKLTSPKVNRTNLTKRQEKSPVLNVRKNNSINTALKANASLHGEHASKLLQKSATHSGVHQIDSTNTPAPSSKQSHQPNYASTTPDNMSAVSSDDDSDHINVDKLKTIRSKAAAHRSHEHPQQDSNNQSKDRVDASAENRANSMPKSTEVSAIIIQKIWRGYNTRKQNKYIAENLQKSRTQEYIERLSHDMETTKVALENERKIQQLQMQAINALWKKVSTLQPTPATSAAITADLHALASGTEPANTNSTAVVQDLAKTCTVLTNQVQQLQGSMRDIIQCMTVLCKLPPSQEPQQSVDESKPKAVVDVKDSSSTQTEIVAVHTPQVENLPFPFANKLPRPSTLMLIEKNESASTGQKLTEMVATQSDLAESIQEIDTARNGHGDSSAPTTEATTLIDPMSQLD